MLGWDGIVSGCPRLLKASPVNISSLSWTHSFGASQNAQCLQLPRRHSQEAGLFNPWSESAVSSHKATRTELHGLDRTCRERNAPADSNLTWCVV